MPVRVFSVANVGLEAQIIETEVDVSYGLRSFNIVGLPDKAVEESKERVGAAIKSSGFSSPHQLPIRVLVNLAPADFKKEGALYDFPIAIGFLVASKQISFSLKELDKRIFVGELSLDGKLRPIKGVLSFSLKCKKEGFSEIVLPKANAPEAALVEGIKVIGVSTLKEAICYLQGSQIISPPKIEKEKFFETQEFPVTLDCIKGQEYAKRALEIAAAGSHNLLMQGSPGSGKTLLAKAITSILPLLSFDESLEVTKIYSIAGLLPKDKPLINIRPFRAPHHTTSETALIGGGNPPKIGEITLAHRGVLFLDEFPEFHRDILESLRQPIEEGKIVISRAKYRFVFPAKFMLVAAANPCPCGYYGDPERECTCTPSQIAMYRRKLSGPLIDRIDISINVPRVKYEKLTAPEDKNLTSNIREKIKRAREIQINRFIKDNLKILTNSEIPISKIKKYCSIDSKSENLLKKYINSGILSARGYHRVLKVARTIADLENSENILYEHLAEALMYRIKE